jgi:hypothetical protein
MRDGRAVREDVVPERLDARALLAAAAHGSDAVRRLAPVPAA